MVPVHICGRVIQLVWEFCLVSCAGWMMAIPSRREAAELYLTSPRGGESWCIDSIHTITWKSSEAPAGATVTIEFSSDGGIAWKAIVAATANTGRYAWKVPGPPAKTCRVRLTLNPRGPVAASAADFAIAPSQAVADYRWAKVTKEAAFAPRDGAGALVFNGRMWLLGGWNPADKKHFPRICNNEVWSSRDGHAWTLEKPNTFLDERFDPSRDWEGRHTAGYVVHQNRMWIVGGDVNQGHYHHDVWNSADGKTWRHVNKGRPVPWGPRALHHTLAFKEQIWVLGGQTIPQIAAEKEMFHRDIWRTTDGREWQPVKPREPYPPARGMIGGSAVFQGRMWVLGGGTYDTPQRPARSFYNDVWSSADGVAWMRHVEFAPWAPRQYHDVAVFDGRLWVLEGYAGENRNDVWYSNDGINWYELPNTPWAARHAASVFVHDNALWMAAGNNMEPDVWKLTRESR